MAPHLRPAPLPLPLLAVLVLVLALARLTGEATGVAAMAADMAAEPAEDPPDADGGGCTLVQQPGVQLNPRLFGYNLEVYGTMINNSFSDTAGLAIADALHLGALRYPGGTMSNVWDPILGRYTETTAAGGAYEKFAMYAKIVEDAGPPGTFSAARFMEGIGGRSRAVIWDLNVFSFNISRACAQIEYIATLPPPPAGLETFLELGNELYSESQGMPRFPTGANYAEAMAPIVRCARAVLPNAKIAAVGYRSGADSSAWVKGVAEHAADFDAVSIHVYSPATSAVNKYNKTGGGVDDQLTYVMGYSRALMHTIANRSVADFGAEKKLWMTEFNYGLQADIFLPQLDFGALHGIFHASRIVAAVELHNCFDALTFQTFVHPIPYPPYASAYHRSMPVARISPLPNRPDLAKISGTAQLVSHTAFHALRSETMHPMQSAGCAKHGDEPCLQAAAFATAQNSSKTLAVVNICQQPVQARMASRPPPEAANYAWTIYSAKDPGGWGAIPTDPDKLPWDTGPLRPTHTTGATLPTTLTFPALSFSVLHTGSKLHKTPPFKTDDSAAGLLQPPPGTKCNDPAVANAACFGFDPADSTKAVRAALATNKSKVVIPKMDRPWIVSPLGGPAALHLLHQHNMTIILESGVEIQAMRGDYHQTHQRLFLIEDCSNITILAYGSSMSMWREDYANLSLYSKLEWRAGLAVYDSQHLRLFGLNISRTGGDGMTLTDVRNVHVKDTHLLNNYRQGLSLIAVLNVTVEDSVFAGTDGQYAGAFTRCYTFSQCSLQSIPNNVCCRMQDIEPDDAITGLVNITFRRVVSRDNQGCGFSVAPGALESRQQCMNIRFEDCIAERNGLSGYVSPPLRQPAALVTALPTGRTPMITHRRPPPTRRRSKVCMATQAERSTLSGAACGTRARRA